MTSGVPKRGPLWVWVGTVGADLVLEILSLYEFLEGLLRDGLVHLGSLELKVTTWDGHHFISSRPYTLLESITNLSTPIPSYFPPTVWSIFSRRLRGLRFHPSVAVPQLHTSPLDSQGILQNASHDSTDQLS